MLPINLPCSWTNRCLAYFKALLLYVVRCNSRITSVLPFFLRDTYLFFIFFSIYKCTATYMLSSKCAILANNGELTCKSSYTVFSNVHYRSDMQVLADPCIRKKKRQAWGSVRVLCEYTVRAVKRVIPTATQLCMLSPLSVSVLIQLSERMYGMVTYIWCFPGTGTLSFWQFSFIFTYAWINTLTLYYVWCTATPYMWMVHVTVYVCHSRSSR